MERKWSLAWTSYLALLCLVATSPWATYRHLPATHILVPVALTAMVMAYPFLRWILGATGIKNTPITASLFAYVAWVGLSVFWTQNLGAWRTAVLWQFICALLFVATFSIVNDRWKAHGLALACVVAAVATFPLLTTDFYESFGVQGAYSVFAHNVNFTAYCLASAAFCILLTLAFLRPAKAQLLALYLVGLVAVGAGLWLLGSRAAQLSFFGAIVAIVVAPRVTAFTRMALIVLMVLASLLLMTGLFFPWITLLGAGDSSFRDIVWAEAWGVFAKYPTLGVGSGAFPHLNVKGIETHNLLLGIAVSYGLVGIALFLIFAWQCVSAFASHGQKTKFGLIYFAYFLPIASTGHIEAIPMMWIATAFTIAVARLSERRWAVGAYFAATGTAQAS